MAFASLTIDLNARLANIERDMGRAAQVAERNSQRMQAGFAKAATAATALAGALGVGSFAAFIKSSIDAADETAKLSQKLGISVEHLAGYKVAADLSGISMEGFGTAASQLNKHLAENNPLLKALGITARDANGAMVQLADVFGAIPDGAQKTAIAMQLMGRAGTDMIPLLNGGGAALQDMITKGRELNPITTEMAKQAEKFNDQLTLLKASASSAGIQIADPLVSAMNEAIEAAQRASREYGVFAGILVGLGSLETAPFRKSNAEQAIAIQEEQYRLEQQIEKIQGGGGSSDVKAGGIAALRSRIRELGEELDAVFRKDKLHLLSRDELKAAAAKTIGDNEMAKRLSKLNVGAGAKAGADKLDQLDPFGAQRRTAEKAALDAIVAGEQQAFDALAEMRDYQIAQDERAAAELGRLRAAHLAVIDPIQQYRDRLEEVERLLDSGLMTPEQAAAAGLYWQEQIDSAAGFGAEIKRQASEMDVFLETAGKNFQSALADYLFDPFSDGLGGMLQGFGIMLRRMAAEAIAADITRAVFGGKDNTSNILAGLASSAGSSTAGSGQNFLGHVASLFGFAHGGSFTVGGGGGTDSQIVAFRATPNEEVTIRTPAQQREGAGITVQGPLMVVNTNDASSFSKSRGQIQADIAAAVNAARRFT